MCEERFAADIVEGVAVAHVRVGLPCDQIVLFGQLRTDVALHAGAFETLKHLLLFGAERVHRLLSSLGAR